MKLLVVSDTHGNRILLERIVKEESPFDYLIHCGDGVDDLHNIAIPENAIVVRVRGNMDQVVLSDLEEVAFLNLGNARLMISHGHRFQVHNGYWHIEREGSMQNVAAVVFGHTHAPFLREDSPVLFNPGPGLKGCYGVIEVRDRLFFIHRRLET